MRLDIRIDLVYPDYMSPLQVILHGWRCKIEEELFLEKSLRAQFQARVRVVRQAEQLRADLARARGRSAAIDVAGQLVTASQNAAQLPQGMARRLANLTYDINEARQLALAKYRGRKQQLMAQLVELLATGQDFTLRDLAAQLGTSYESVRRYRGELVTMGLVPA